MRKSRNHLAIVEANLRLIVREAARLSEDYDYDITPADAYGLLVSAQRALDALTGTISKPASLERKSKTVV